MISASSGDLYPFFGNNKSWSTALSATVSTTDVCTACSATQALKRSRH